MTDNTDTDPADQAFWESINMATNDDILSIVMDSLAGRSTADRTMDRISIRCEAIRTAYAPGIVTLINATEVEANKHKRTMAYLEDARAKIQEQAKEIARLHDELTCEFCEKEAGPENPCVCLDCYHESI